MSTYNSDYDYSSTVAASISAFSGFDICSRDPDAVYISGGQDRFCKVMLKNDPQPYYCRTTASMGYGSNWEPGDSDGVLIDCSNLLCNSGYTAVWNDDMQTVYGCARYHPNSNCWEHGGDTEVSVNPSQYSNIITNYKSMNDGALECDFNRRARPSTNGNCANPNLGELLKCYCAYDESYYVSGNEEPNENGQITILCAPCPAYADCNGQRDRFRCRAGYYDYDPNLSGRGANCVPCPSASSNIIDFCDTQPTSPKAATSITQCYLPTGTMCKDVYGTFSIVNRNCYYLN